jgi:hypothetical protein
MRGPTPLVRQHLDSALANEASKHYARAFRERTAIESLIPKDACYGRDPGLSQLQIQNRIDAGLDAYWAHTPSDAVHYWRRALTQAKLDPTAGEKAFAAGYYSAGFRSYCKRFCDPDIGLLNPAFSDAGLTKALSAALDAGATGDFRKAHDSLASADMYLKSGPPWFPAGHYILGAADKALGHDADACRAWATTIAAWIPAPGDRFTARYDEFTIGGHQVSYPLLPVSAMRSV